MAEQMGTRIAASARRQEEVIAISEGQTRRVQCIKTYRGELFGNVRAFVECRNRESRGGGVEVAHGSGKGGAEVAIAESVLGPTADTGRTGHGDLFAATTDVRARSVDSECTVIAIDESAQHELDPRAGFL